MKMKKWRIARANYDGLPGWALFAPDGYLYGLTCDSWGYSWEQVVKIFTNMARDWEPG